ncbi:aldo/keto reductase, partial [Rhizobium ruizarguesonis]
HIMDSVEASLKRLQTDHIDLYQIHDVATRGAEIVRLVAHDAVDIGGNDDVLARDVEILQRLAEQPLGLAG